MVGSAHPTTVYLKEQNIGRYRRQTVETALQCVHALARRYKTNCERLQKILRPLNTRKSTKTKAVVITQFKCRFLCEAL